MGFTQNCSAGALQVPSAVLHADVHHESWNRLGCETKRATSGNGEARIWTYSFCSTRKTRARTKDFSSGCILASRRESTLDNLQQQNAFSCHSWLWAAHNRSSNPGSLSLSLSQRLCAGLTVLAHSNNTRSINSPSPGSPRFDSDEEMEFQEKGKRGSKNVFQDFDSVYEGEKQNGDEQQMYRDRLHPSSSSSASDGPYIGYDNLSRSDSGASDILSKGSKSHRQDESSFPCESRLENDEEGVGVSREDSGADSAGYESWGEDSETSSTQSGTSGSVGSAADSLAIGGKEPVYQVLEVHPDGDVVQREVSRRQLLRSTAGLRLRDIRSVDPSLWVTNSVPAILVRDQAILLNLGSLRAIATSHSVLIFERKSVGAQAFMESLLPRLRTAFNGHGPIMPFELEVVEAALISRTQRLERMLMDVEPRVVSLLKVLPNRYTADVLEELRLGKQALVELAAKAGALRQMLLELLEHPQDIRKMTIMGRTCNIRREDGSVECSLPLDKQSAEDEEQEIEMLLEYYLQRCDSCHGQAEKLLDSAKEMEDSISVNLSSRRLEVSRLELLLQVGTFCSALGALVAGIFGMNLKSYLEEHVMAFYFTTAGIIFGGIALFIAMFSYLKIRRIL